MIQQFWVHIKKNANLKRYTHPSVHSSTVHNSQDVEATKMSTEDEWIKKMWDGTSLLVQWLRIHFQCTGHGLTPGWGTKIPHAEGQLSPYASMRQPACCILQSPPALEPMHHREREAHPLH